MGRYAIVGSSGNVVNVIVAEPDFDPGPGLTLVDPGDAPVAPGWAYSGGQFQPPAPPPLPSLQEAQQQKIAEINSQAYALLQLTDWVVIRSMENQHPLPDDLVTWRKAVRDAANKAAADIQAMTDVQAVLAYQPQWPEPVRQYIRLLSS